MVEEFVRVSTTVEEIEGRIGATELESVEESMLRSCLRRSSGMIMMIMKRNMKKCFQKRMNRK